MVHIYNKRCKKSFKYIVGLAITTNINTLAFAGNDESRFNIINDNINYCKIESNDITRKLISLKGNDFINEVSEMESSCLVKIALASPKELKIIISKENMVSISTAAVAEVNRFNPSNPKKLLNFTAFLNLGYFLQSQNPYFIPDYNDNNENSLKNKIATLTHTYAIKIFSEKPTPTLKVLSKQVFGLINSAKSYEESLSLIEYITENSKAISNKDTNPLYDAILPIQKSLAATHDAGGIYFKLNKPADNASLSTDVVVKSEKIVKNIAKIINEEKNTLDEKLYRNYIRELGKFLRYNHHRDEVSAVLKNVIKNTTRNSVNGKEDPTPIWVEAVDALEVNKIVNANNCQNITDKNNINICDAKSKLSNELFENRRIYDEGDIVIFSSLDKAETDRLYLAMKQVEALYKRTNQTLKPVKNDPNKRLQVFIYRNAEEYNKYKSYVSDNYDDGLKGFYVESIGSFYTYAGVIDLEETVRHEYVHYLNARYLVHGIDGDTSSFVKKWSRMKWFEEGSAEFFARATQSDGFVKSRSNIKSIDLNNIRPIKEIANASLDTLPTDVMYNQSYALVSYLYNKQPSIFKPLIKSIKENEVAKFDSIVDKISNDEQYTAEYKSYIQELANSSDLSEATTPQVNSNFFEMSDLKSIQVKMQNEGLTISKCEVVASSDFGNAQARFGCSGNAQSVIDENANIKLNSALKNLVTNDNRFIYTNCMFGDGTFYCEGPLKSASFNQLSNVRKKDIKVSNNAQRKKTFKGTTEHFYFFTGDTLSDTLFTSQRRLEGQIYNYNQNKNPNRGELVTNKNGELTYTNKGTSSDDYKKVTAQVGISEKHEIPLDNSNPHNINVNIFKFKEIDERMFNYEFYLDDKNSIPGTMIYRNEYNASENNKDGFRVFTDDFRNTAVNDLDFEIIKKPESANAKIYARYMLHYSNPNKLKGQDDEIVIRVRKHNQITADIKIKIKDKDQKAKNPLIDIAKNDKNVETFPITLQTYNGDTGGMIYSEVEHLLPSGFKYNYSVIENPKCQIGFRLADYGAFNYQSNGFCDVGTTDEALILVTKVTNSELTPVMKIKVTFQINKQIN